MHVMKVDPASGLVDVTVEGFWDMAYVAEFLRDLTVAKTQARVRGKPARVLVDYSQAAIQTQEVVKALQAMVANIDAPSYRVALFTDRQMATMQARRVASMRERVAVFADRDTALAWLMAH